MQKIIVTGAEEHQAVAVIRGLGLAGLPVVACGLKKHSAGFYSRYAAEHCCYTAPYEDARKFTTEIVEIAARTGAGMVIPAVESTLVALDRYRHLLEDTCVLAVPPSAILECVIDKKKTVELARQIGVPVPKTFFASSPEELDLIAETLPYPVALKPRGNRLHIRTEHRLGFKVKYADNTAQLRRIVRSLPPKGGAMLAQQFVRGEGVCVAAVVNWGEPIVLFPYVRQREWPITGGISVVRESIPLDEELRRYCENLLRVLCWHGIAMLEFKRVRSTGEYVLMEINGRFQASTALSLDAGLNLPAMVYALYSEDNPNAECVHETQYRIGVRERWLSGDYYSLLDFLAGRTRRNAIAAVRNDLPWRSRIFYEFVRDCFSKMHYDEFKSWDIKPGLVQALGMVRLTPSYLRTIASEIYRNWQRVREEKRRARMAELAPALRVGAMPSGVETPAKEEGVPETTGAGNRT